MTAVQREATPHLWHSQRGVPPHAAVVLHKHHGTHAVQSDASLIATRCNTTPLCPRTPPSFFTSTIASRAALLASAAWGADPISAAVRFVHGTRDGGSNSPSLIRTRNCRRQASRSRSGETSPLARAAGRYCGPEREGGPGAMEGDSGGREGCWKAAVGVRTNGDDLAKAWPRHHLMRVLGAEVGATFL